MIRTGWLKLLPAVFLTLFISCKKDSEIIPPPVEKTALKFNFKGTFNNEPLIYNRSSFYTNTYGDSLSVSKFNYYLSNIVLTTNNGSIFFEPESYHLIKHDELSSTSFTLHDLPEGTYTKIEFLIGVDSLRNVSGSQTGDLNPSNLMFWDWNSGYVFFKLEGEYKSPSQDLKKAYSLHVGGFSGTLNCIRKCTFDLSPLDIQVTRGKTPSVYYNVSLDEIFKNPVNINLDSYNSVSGGKWAGVIATNYADMFTIDKIEN